MRAAFLIVLLCLPSSATSLSSQSPPFTVPECTGIALSADSDHDGLTDACELALAVAVAPVLVVRSLGCDWDASAERPRLGGGYFFAVQPIDSLIRVAYMPAYFQDCGWRGAKCWLPWVNCTPHAGDSEIVIVELERVAAGGTWLLSGLFLSAHCFGRSGGSCRWYRAGDLAQFEWQDSAPVVWVAEGRHANYPSKRACDRGHHSLDTCDRHDVTYAFPIDSSRNIGSRAVPLSPGGCVEGAALGHSAANSAAVECFWRQDTPFRGWQAAARGVTPYDRYLREIAEF